MSVYIIIQSTIKNIDKYNQYIEKVHPVVEKYGGRYHVRGGPIRPFGSWNPERMIVIEFPSEDHIHNWLSSQEYAAIAPLREAGADAQAIVVEGYQDTRRKK